MSQSMIIFLCRYADRDVPDTMSVHGIYDTEVQIKTFASKNQYQHYLQEKASMSTHESSFS